MDIDATTLSQAVDVIIPDHLAEHRPLGRRLLEQFLTRLSQARRQEVGRTIAGLPDGHEPADRLITLMHCCPALHKLGQVIARHRGIDPQVRRHLQRLETFPPVTPAEELRGRIYEDLRRLRCHEDVKIAPQPIAEASVAVVVPIEWHRTPSGPRQPGIIKVRKPGVEERLREDLAVLGELADELARAASADGAPVPALDYRDIFETVRDLLLREVHFEVEQTNLAQALAWFEERADVFIPRLLPFCTPDMTAMTRVAGRKVTEVETLPSADRHDLARTIVESLVADIIFAREGDAVFHADPHAGNLMRTEDGRLAILDWSLTGRLAKEERVRFAQIIMTAMQYDAAGVARAVTALSSGRADERLILDAAEQSLAELRRGYLPGPAWMVRLMDRVAASGVTFAGDLLLFRKTLLTVEGVVRDVCEGASLDAIILAAGMRAFAREWPRRLCTGLDSRDFSTHLSNGDLMGLCMAAPFAAGHYWVQAWRDWSSAAVRPIWPALANV